jgi:hypothetical protein
MGSKNKKSISLNDEIRFSSAGTKSNEIVLLLFINILPIIVFSILSLFIGANETFITIGITGLIGILKYNMILNKIESQYLKEKYNLIRNFRITQ